MTQSATMSNDPIEAMIRPMFDVDPDVTIGQAQAVEQFRPSSASRRGLAGDIDLVVGARSPGDPR